MNQKRIKQIQVDQGQAGQNFKTTLVKIRKLSVKIEENIDIGSNGILHGVKLRFENEPVRHKALDVIGDLALLGMPIKGHIIAARPGHAANVEIVKKIKKQFFLTTQMNVIKNVLVF